MKVFCSWNGNQSSPLSVSLLACGTVNIVCKYLIINFLVKYAPKGRPINTITLIDQVITILPISFLNNQKIQYLQVGQLGLYLVFTVLIVGSILLSTPLDHLFGQAGCTILWLVGSLHNACVCSGALTIALFRMAAVYLHKSSYAKCLRTRMTAKFLVAFEWIIIAIIITPIWIGKENSGSSLVMQFCNGHSSNMETIIMRYEGVTEETMAYGHRMSKLSFMMGQAIVAVELGIYVYLFHHLRNHNRSMASTVSQEELRRRHQGNVINMYGQAVSCLVSTLTITGMVVMVQMDNNHFFSPASTNCFLVLSSVLNSISFISASPELRRTYFSN